MDCSRFDAPQDRRQQAQSWTLPSFPGVPTSHTLTCLGPWSCRVLPRTPSPDCLRLSLATFGAPTIGHSLSPPIVRSARFLSRAAGPDPTFPRLVLYACVRDGLRTYTSTPLPTDSACRTIKYRWVDKRPVQPDPPGTFMGYKCSSDCSGHKAGYAWASEQGTSSVQNCRGSSKSFVEGCMAYVTSKTKRNGAKTN